MAFRGDPLTVAVAVVAGSAVGSFLNVVIFRLPRGESLISPGSRCLACGHPLSFRDMVPVISYFALRGRCRYCRAYISPIYPLIEALTASAFGYLAATFGTGPDVVGKAIFLCLLIVAAAIDLREMIIPDKLVVSGAVLWALLLPASAYFRQPPPDSAWETVLHSAAQGIAGAAVGFFIFLVIAFTTSGMGGGDVKLAAMCGLYLGPASLLVALAITFVAGGIAALLLLASGKARPGSRIPYGPFIVLGAASASLYGQAIIHWYFHALFP